MFNEYSFNLTVTIDPIEENKQLYFIPIEGANAKNQVLEDWYCQYKNFTTYKDNKRLIDKRPVVFSPGNKADDEEILIIEDYKLPTYLEKMNTSNIVRINPIRSQHIRPDIIKSIIGFAKDDNQELMLFQKFQSKNQLIESKMTLLFDSDALSFNKISDSGLILNNKLSAVYNAATKTLMFRNFRDVSSILDLDEYFKPLSEEEIREFLKHDLFEPEDVDQISTNPSYLLCERFAIVSKSKILDSITAEDVKLVSKKYPDVDVKLSSDGRRIIFPSRKSDAHKLLRLLNENYYTGDFSEEPYLAINKRNVN